MISLTRRDLWVDVTSLQLVHTMVALNNSIDVFVAKLVSDLVSLWAASRFTINASLK